MLPYKENLGFMGYSMFHQLAGLVTAVSSTDGVSTQLLVNLQGCQIHSLLQALGHGKQSSGQRGWVWLS